MRSCTLWLLVLLSCQAWPQTTSVPKPPAPNSAAPASPITLDQAIQMAKANAPEFRAALTEAGIAREDRVQARAALLPNVSYATGAVFTEANGRDTGVYIGANAVNEYISQGLVHQELSLSSVADLRRAGFLDALGRAKSEIAARGLVTTIVKDFYEVIASQRKLLNGQRAADEARGFLTLSRQLENGGEVAHSDVIKAQLQSNDRERERQEAQLAEEKARLELAVLIFPTFTRDYELADDLQQTPVLPEQAHVQDLASRNNPELTAAIANMRASQQEVASAVGGHLPSLSMNYFYGIDATRYATRTDGLHNLGFQLTATLDFPIFNWGATQSKVKQAQLRRDQARVELSAAQRQSLANLEQFYHEAETAHRQLDVLQQSADLAAEGLRLTNLRYRSGEATALEVVDAQNTLVQARNNYDDGAVRYRVAIANLQTLTGSF